MEVNNKKIFILAIIIVAICIGVIASSYYLTLKKTIFTNEIGVSVPKETVKRFAAEATVEAVNGNVLTCNVTLHDTQKKYTVTVGKDTKIFSQSGQLAPDTQAEISKIHPGDSIDIISYEDFDNKTAFELAEIRKTIPHAENPAPGQDSLPALPGHASCANCGFRPGRAVRPL